MSTSPIHSVLGNLTRKWTTGRAALFKLLAVVFGWLGAPGTFRLWFNVAVGMVLLVLAALTLVDVPARYDVEIRTRVISVDAPTSWHLGLPDCHQNKENKEDDEKPTRHNCLSVNEQPTWDPALSAKTFKDTTDSYVAIDAGARVQIESTRTGLTIITSADTQSPFKNVRLNFASPDCPKIHPCTIDPGSNNRIIWTKPVDGDLTDIGFSLPKGTPQIVAKIRIGRAVGDTKDTLAAVIDGRVRIFAGWGSLIDLVLSTWPFGRHQPSWTAYPSEYLVAEYPVINRDYIDLSSNPKGGMGGTGIVSLDEKGVMTIHHQSVRWRLNINRSLYEKEEEIRVSAIEVLMANPTLKIVLGILAALAAIFGARKLFLEED